MPILQSSLRCAHVLIVIASTIANAQTGRVDGRVTDPSGTPVAGVNVGLVGVQPGTTTNRDGRFSVVGVPPGEYRVAAVLIGFGSDTVTAVVRRDEVTTVTLRLRAIAVQLQGIVISASRRAEKLTEAPATVTVFSASQVESRLGSSYLPVLRDVAGLTATQVGVTSIVVNGRGFNRLFNTRWLTIEDGRVASLPETGLPVGEHTTISKVDVADVEVVVGPGSALYGSNASSGVLSVRTRDPRTYPGLTAELSVGTRSFADAQVRYAGAQGDWGYKITGGYQSADEWKDPLYYAVGGTTVLEKTPWNPHVTRASGSLVRYLPRGAQLRLNVGASERTGLRELAAGRQRVLNHVYDHYQAEFVSSRWYANAYTTHSNTGDTYFLFTEAQRSVSPPGLSADSIRSLSSFHLDGRLLAVEVQNNFTVGMLARTGLDWVDDAQVIWGGQLRRDRVSSYSLLYRDRVTGRPIHLDTPSGYAQIESPLGARWRVVIAGRYDDPDIFDPQFSPKVALLYSPAPEQTVRLTFNKAYSAPGTRESQTFNGRALGPNQTLVSAIDGLVIRDATGNVVNTIAPLRPEGNETWELGYKGVLGRRLYADLTAYRSHLTAFITNAIRVADPFATQGARTRAYNARTGELVADANGNPLVAFSYLNAGSGVVYGLDAAMRYYLSDRVSLRSNASLARVDTIEVVASAPDASLFNTSTTSISAALELTDAPRLTSGNFTVRYVNGFDFRSGLARGHIPTFGTLDLSTSRRLESLGTTIILQVQNLATCVSGETTYPATGVVTGGQLTYTRDRRCGVGVRHREMLFMPAVGPMLVVGARREWR